MGALLFFFEVFALLTVVAIVGVAVIVVAVLYKLAVSLLS